MKKYKLKLKLHVTLILQLFIDSYNKKEVTKIFNMRFLCFKMLLNKDNRSEYLEVFKIFCWFTAAIWIIISEAKKLIKILSKYIKIERVFR